MRRAFSHMPGLRPLALDHASRGLAEGRTFKDKGEHAQMIYRSPTNSPALTMTRPSMNWWLPQKT